MASTEPRRSSRLHVYDANGRDFLADKIGWSREQLETWITSPTVRPHLQLWYQICIFGRKRYNEAVQWINTGEKGYFYNEKDLEEDILLMCLSEGADGEQNHHDSFSTRNNASYADTTVKTGDWITQEIWARTAWRIVQDNRGQGQAFEKHAIKHPAASYGFVIDLLCLSFHSIAFRGQASCYEYLINGDNTIISYDSREKSSHQETGGEDDDASVISASVNDSSMDDGDNSSDDDYTDIESRTSAGETPATSKQSESNQKNDVEEVQQWVDGLEHNPLVTKPCDPCVGGENSSNLTMVDENGAPITGYRAASACLAEVQGGGGKGMSFRLD